MVCLFVWQLQVQEGVSCELHGCGCSYYLCMSIYIYVVIVYTCGPNVVAAFMAFHGKYLCQLDWLKVLSCEWQPRTLWAVEPGFSLTVFLNVIEPWCFTLIACAFETYVSVWLPVFLSVIEPWCFSLTACIFDCHWWFSLTLFLSIINWVNLLLHFMAWFWSVLQLCVWYLFFKVEIPLDSN